EVAKRKPLIPLRFCAELREHELEFVALPKDQVGAGLRTHANPVDTRRRDPGAVRLDRDLEALTVEGLNQLLIELEERLASGADDKRTRLRGCLLRPRPRDRGGEVLTRVEASTAG